MRLVADSHAIVWYTQNSPQLSPAAGTALDGAAATDGGIVVSVATLVDLWYVTQTTQGVTTSQLAALRQHLDFSPAVDLHAVTLDVADTYTHIDRTLLTDPWDRFIVATALALPLVTRDGRIQRSGLVETLW